MNHSIKVAAQRAGLTPHVIRVWEKRYGAVTPARTKTNRRLYSDEEIERLGLLRHATHSGHSISHVAKLPTGKLKALVVENETRATRGVPGKAAPAAKPGQALVEECVAAIRELNSRALEEVMNRAGLALGSQGFLQNVVVPLTQVLGDLWRDGVVKAAHEHFASAAIRAFLAGAVKPFAIPDTAPRLLVATPPGQLHELGAVIVSAAATNQGWHVTYLGTSLPAVEIAGAALQNQCRAVALSIVYPQDDPHLPDELIQLRRYLPGQIAILAGGRAASAYSEVLKQIGAIQAADLEQLYRCLDELRAGKKSR